jgi:hypothetical protein
MRSNHCKMQAIVLYFITRKLLNQGFLLFGKVKVITSKILRSHYDLVDRYGISVSQMTTDNRQHNGQTKKDNRTNSDLQNITHKTKDRVTRTPLKTGGKLRCSGRVSSSWSTSGTRRVNLVTNLVLLAIVLSILLQYMCLEHESQ